MNLETKGTGKNTRTPYLEVLRIVAVLCVIFIHTGRNGNFLYLQRPAGGAPYWIYMFISAAGQFSVPVFLAVSGAVLLGRDKESAGSWLRRILRILVTLVMISFAYYVRDVVRFEEILFSWKDFFTRLYSQMLKGHLWYMYQYIAYLLALPFLRAMVKTLEDRYFYYIFGSALVMNGIIPVIEYCLFKGDISLNSYKSSLWFVTGVVLYPCMGYFIHNRIGRGGVKKRVIIGLWITNLAGIVISCLMTNLYSVTTGKFDESIANPFFASFVALNCAALFITLKTVFERIQLPGPVERVIVSAGKCTFGIYLLHYFIIETPKTYHILERVVAGGVNEMCAAWMACICIFIICYAATLILSIIPGIRKLVGFR